ncbi:MAG: alpha/beta hydrolase [Rhodobacteraceae bacterium]|nr:alpha/beta hydrolase [Paracoccaceae bacterium]
MPLLRINAIDGALRTTGTRSVTAALGAALAVLPPGAPVIVMLHGYKYTPLSAAHSPHSRLLSLKPTSARARFMSWPRRMGFGQGDPTEGLCIAFGWHGRGTIWQAYREAGEVGKHLALLLGMIRARSAAPLHVLAHSLGCRVALAAVEALPARGVDRMILMSAAEFRSRADLSMSRPAGQTAEVINVTSRENDLFDAMLEGLLQPLSWGDPALSEGLETPRPNWLDLQIDDTDTLAALGRLGFEIKRPDKRVCHWSGYVRPGMLAFHNALLRQPNCTRLSELRAALPETRAPRWSRLFARNGRDPLLSDEVYAPL